MPKSTETCNNLLALIFNATTWAGFAVNHGAPLTNLYLALYTSDPGIGADPRNNEVGTGAYGGYARISVARTTGGWLAPTGGVTKNTALAQFAECSGGTGAVITYVGIVNTASGDGDILYKGQLSAPRTVADGIQPQFAPEALVVTET
jgi:hypothetical protein